MLSKFVGSRVREVDLVDFTWVFGFASGCVITTDQIWRIVTSDRMAISDSDHQQPFGRGLPTDAAAEALGLLGPSTVREISLAPITSDLLIKFTADVELQFLNTSSGYEGWHVTVSGEGGGEIIQLGGGELAIIRT